MSSKRKELSSSSSAVIGIDITDMDTSVSPGSSFFSFANGGWQAKNPIPEEHPAWNNFIALHTQSQERLRALLGELAVSSSSSSSSSSSKKAKTESNDDDDALERNLLSTFYSAAMDEEAIERAGGRAPLTAALAVCARAAAAAGSTAEDKAARATAIAELHLRHGVDSVFFCLYASPDKKNADHTLCQVAQGGTNLPDRDYYFDGAKQQKREAYVAHIARSLALIHKDDDKDQDDEQDVSSHYRIEDGSAMRAAVAVYTLEAALASAHMTKTEKRDAEKTYNKMSVAALSALADDAFDFATFFAVMGKSGAELGDVNVCHTVAIAHAARVLAATPASTLTHYLRWHVVHAAAPYLTRAHVEERFDFFQRELSGTKALKPRWKRAMEHTEGALGDALGKLYCRRHFSESSKTLALEMVENVRAALEQRLGEVTWITSEETRAAALAKMRNFRVKIGYPDKWIDYSSLVLSSDDTSYYAMCCKADEFHARRMVADWNQPTDRERWLMTPQTINAYYHPSLNEIVFPAAILQPPFFDPEADDACRYGAIGAVIAHEMTHGYDDQGCKYDANGTMRDWWTPADKAEYDKRVAVCIKQANAFVVEGMHVQGSLTQGENVADCGGVCLALRALQRLPGFDALPKIDGFTPTQRFFLSWATAWRQNVTAERSKQLITVDPHGPNVMRCDMTVRNVQAFYDAFDVKEGDDMWLAPAERMDIW